MLCHTDHLIRIRRNSKKAANGRARYRVVACERSIYPNLKKVHLYHQPKGQVTIVTSHPVKVGSFINLRKALGFNTKKGF